MVDNKKIKTILFLISILLISMSMVLSISVWNNRSLFFDEHVYSRTDYSHYAKLGYESIKNNDSTNMDLSNYSFVYYNFFIDDKWHTNLPNDISIIGNENIISVYVKENINNKDFLSNPNIRYSIQSESNDKVDEAFVEGYIYIDMSKNLLGTLQYSIGSNLKLQSLLYFDCAAFLVLIITGLILLFNNLKMGQAYISDKLEIVPIDIKLILFIFSTVLILSLYPLYIKTFGTFTYLRKRITLFGLLTALIFLGVVTFLDMFYMMRAYKNNYMELKNKWDNRYLRRLPVSLSCFILLIILYMSMLSSFNVYESFNRYNFIRENLYILTIYFIILVILSFAISKIIKAKSKYTNIVLSEIKEIVAGNLVKDVAVIGKDEISDIAANVNLIKEGYIKAIEEQKKSERLKYELITNISHDLRSPLTTIINYLDLSKTYNSEESLKRYIEGAESNSKILLLLIEDLFELSKMESGNVELSKTNIDLILLLKQVSHEYNIICKDENKEIIFISSLNEIEYSCDSLSISRLFNNLIDNAIRYSLPNTRIYIEVTYCDKEIRVEVKNIASYKLDFDLNELFLRFKRGDKSRTAKGTGLGLAIAKGIASLHNGSITLKNDGDLFKAIVILPIE